MVALSYCFNNSLDSCYSRGRGYTWASAMNLDLVYNTTRASRANGLDSVVRFPAQGICPEGWHIPDSTEWGELRNYVKAVNLVDYDGEGAGTSLKSKNPTANWKPYAGVDEGTDRFGLSIIPAGILTVTKNYGYDNQGAYIWSSTENSATGAWRFKVGFELNDIEMSAQSKRDTRYVRCLKNSD